MGKTPVFITITLALLSLSYLSPQPANASALSDLANSMQPGEWRELATNNFSGGQILTTPGRPGTGNILEYTDEAQWDPVGKKLYIIGTALPYNYENQKWVEYSEATNSWIDRTNDVPFYVGFHSYDHAALDSSRRHYYVRVVGSRTAYRYDFTTGQWTQLPDIPDDQTMNECCGGLEYFPEIDRVVYVGTFYSINYLFNPSTNSWSEQAWGFAGPGSDISIFSEYDPVNGVLYFGGGNYHPYEFYRLDRSGKTTRLATPPVPLGTGGGRGPQTVDPVSGKFLVFMPDGNTYEYDPTNNSWRTAGIHPLSEENPNAPGERVILAVSAKIPEYGVIMAVSFTNYVGKVFLYKHSSGTPPPPDTQAPTIPTNISATAASSSQINLSWTASTDNVGVAGYKIYRNSTLLTTHNSQLTTYSDTGLSPSTTYTYTVAAFDAAGNVSVQSSSTSATTQALPLPGSNININFQPAGVPVPTGYLVDDGAVYANRGNGYTYGWNIDNTSGARDRNASNSPDQRYDTLNHMLQYGDKTWEITLVNATYSVHIVAGDPSNYDEVMKINTEGVLIIDGTTTATSRWLENTLNITVSDGRLTLTNASGAIANKIAFIDIVPVGAPMPDIQAPTAPANLQATALSSSQINLTWSASTDNVGVTGYGLERCQGSSCTNFSQIATPAATSYNDMGLSANATYRYQVRATDAAGNLSSYSSIVSATTPGSGTSLPSGCSAEGGLSGRTDILHCEPWEDTNWWQNGYLEVGSKTRVYPATGPDQSSVVSTGCISGSCLKVTMHSWQEGGSDGALAHHWPIPGNQEEVYLRYYIKLAPNFSPDNYKVTTGEPDTAGGKFPGLADVRAYPEEQCGNGGAFSDGINCWSARARFGHCRGSGGVDICTADIDGKQATTRFGYYWYLAAEQSYDNFGPWDNQIWGSQGGSCSTINGLHCGIGDAGLVNDRWYLMEWQIKMNTPGIANGIARGWIDGVLRYEKTNVEFRLIGHDNLHVRTAWLNVMHGGVSVGPAETTAIYLDQMVVATGNRAGAFVPATLKGDVNNDSSVDILDIQSLVNHILGIQDYGSSADVNKDSSVDVLDVQEVVNIILG